MGEHGAAGRRVLDLGVELETVEIAPDVGDSRQRAPLGPRQSLEALGEIGDGVAVAHPDVEGLGGVEGCERPAGVVDNDVGAPVLAASRVGLDARADGVGEQLHPVTDAEQRHAELEERGVEVGRAGGADRRRTSREDQPPGGRAPGADGALEALVVEGPDLGIDPELAQASRDQQRILAAVVEDEDAVGEFGHSALVRSRRDSWELPG